MKSQLFRDEFYVLALADLGMPGFGVVQTAPAPAVATGLPNPA